MLDARLASSSQVLSCVLTCKCMLKSTLLIMACLSQSLEAPGLY